MKRALFQLIIILIGNLLYPCTNFLISKGASADGSVIISYAADSHVLYGELYYWPARTWPEGSTLSVYEWDTGKYLGEIKQVKQTYTVVGNINEFQVAIGETTFGGRKELAKQPGAIMDYGSLMYIALQRSKTAREAIAVIAQLMEEYGYYSTGESFSIADKNEVWIMEIIGKGEGHKGAVWVALLIPDGYVSAHANHARIRTFPLSNGKTSITSKELHKIHDKKVTCVYAHDVISFAREKGWFQGKDSEFSFSDVYAPIDFGAARFCEMRVWSFFRRINSEMEKYKNYAAGYELENRMPLWIKPDKKLTVHEVMNFMRDHLEGTEFDMTMDIGAGPFGCPYRWRPLTWTVDGKKYFNERATATQQTGFSFVSQSRSWLPDPIGGIIWFGVDDAASCVYTPLYCAIRRVPKSYAEGNGSMMEFSWTSAFWIFNLVSNFAYTRYNIIHPEIYQKQQELEKMFLDEVKIIDQKALELYKQNPDKAIEFLTEFSVNTADQLVKDWLKFFEYLFVKYMDGNVKTIVPGEKNPKVEHPGYPESWYRRIVNETGDKFRYIE